MKFLFKSSVIFWSNGNCDDTCLRFCPVIPEVGVNDDEVSFLIISHMLIQWKLWRFLPPFSSHDTRYCCQWWIEDEVSFLSSLSSVIFRSDGSCDDSCFCFSPMIPEVGVNDNEFSFLIISHILIQWKLWLLPPLFLSRNTRGLYRRRRRFPGVLFHKQ